jgi:hypothetical protein
MAKGSTYSALKAAIVDRLRARPGLSAVTVSYRAPLTTSEVQGESGSRELIHLDDAEDGDHSNVIFGGLPLVLDESYSLLLKVQVLRPGEEQRVADERVDELLFEVLSELANDPTFGVDAPEFEHVQVTYSSFTRTTGFLQNASGHAAGAELELAVEARLSFPTE